ncbi:MAG TPA: DUF3072 domain-containing protein [Polyangiaceae bacterium]|nr:DUF3072 domain-containing protein [Polyangiaceae bacterium]
MNPESAGQSSASEGRAQKDAESRKLGGEPMTSAQAASLRALSEQAGEPFDASLSQAEASRRIDALQARLARKPPHTEESSLYGEPRATETTEWRSMENAIPEDGSD